MSDALLTSTDQEEALSRAYAAAVAAGAGYVTAVPDLDRDSIDVCFSAGGAVRPNIHAQLKSTINLRPSGGELKYVLKRKNYDDLRAPTQVPRILVVLALPKLQKSWLSITLQRLVLKRCAYWVSLRGKAELPVKQQTVTISIPDTNIFDVDALTGLMEKARHGNDL